MLKQIDVLGIKYNYAFQKFQQQLILLQVGASVDNQAVCTSCLYSPGCVATLVGYVVTSIVSFMAP